MAIYISEISFSIVQHCPIVVIIHQGNLWTLEYAIETHPCYQFSINNDLLWKEKELILVHYYQETRKNEEIIVVGATSVRAR